MKFPRRIFVVAVSAACIFNRFAFAEDSAPASKPEQAIQAAALEGKLIYLVFSKESDAATKSVLEIVKAVSTRSEETTYTSVHISDPAGRAIAEKYQVTRAPMPMVIGVHPNGAVTGYFHTKVSETDLVQCVVSPKKAECMKALQQNQLVLICLQSAGKTSIPSGVRDFQADPLFAKRTQVITLSLNDATEATFLKGMEVDPKKDAPITVFLAPPGAIVGKFPIVATKDDLAAKLAEAGKCCDDKNCKYNQQPPKQTQKSERTVR